jgi:hypothetical protein
LVVSVNKVIPPLNYHPIYYFVNGICVKQRVICISVHKQNRCIEEIYEYIAPDNMPNNKIVMIVKK